MMTRRALRSGAENAFFCARFLCVTNYHLNLKLTKTGSGQIKWKKDCEKKPRVSHYRSEMSGGVMNVTIEDCLFGKELFASGVYIKSSPTRGGKVENITARRITLGNLSTSNHRSENASFCAIYTKNDHCTKTGSGQT
jgi:hypothetical protein